MKRLDIRSSSLNVVSMKSKGALPSVLGESSRLAYYSKYYTRLRGSCTKGERYCALDIMCLICIGDPKVTPDFLFANDAAVMQLYCLESIGDVVKKYLIAC